MKLRPLRQPKEKKPRSRPESQRMVVGVSLVGIVCIGRQILSVTDPAPISDLAAVQTSVDEPTTPSLQDGPAQEEDLGVILDNLIADFELTAETLQCSNYAGPMFLPYNPGGKIKRTKPMKAARMPDDLASQPTLHPTQWPLRPFSLHDLRLLPGTRFHTAEATNVAFLRLLDPDRLLFLFRQRAGKPQPKPDLKPYGGWESQGHVLRGEFVGHYLMAAATAAAATGDVELRTRAEYCVSVLAEVQETDGYLSAFSSEEFGQTEKFSSRNPAVPYYVMHKLLAGLLSLHELWGHAPALQVAVRLATHLLGRVHAMLRDGGLERWRVFVNQEVGGTSEALVDLATATGDSQWLQLAALFERPCFVRPLAYAGMARAEGATPSAALAGMHANTHLPQILGTMARYEATGEAPLRAAAEQFWRELHTGHQFVTGGSTTGEVWLEPQRLGDAVTHQHRTNYWAHDQHETCVSHNSMRVSRRLLQWGAPRRREGEAHLVAHAEYYERALLNAVLGTQRGTVPGAMSYMYPMGSGVSKQGIPNAPQGHHWSDAEHHFWCCQGSGVESFARLADSIFWRYDPTAAAGTAANLAANVAANADASSSAASASIPTPSSASRQLFVLQLVSARLNWREQGCTVELRAEPPGTTHAGQPLRCQLRVACRPASERPVAATARASPLTLWLRVPRWAKRPEARAEGALRTLQPPVAGRLMPLRFSPAAGAAAGAATFGAVELVLSAEVTWEPITDARPQMRALLHAPLYGPLVLSALTLGERALPAASQLVPVPASARAQLFSLAVTPPRAEGEAAAAAAVAAAAPGCLVTRWNHVWVLNADRTRSFVRGPSAACLAAASPIEDGLDGYAKRGGGDASPLYALHSAASSAACELDGCLPDGRSPFGNGTLYLMHNGTAAEVPLAAAPPVVPATRRGGTDAANAATWRVYPARGGAVDGAAADAVHLEAFDRPGQLLSIDADERLKLLAAPPGDTPPLATQAWRKLPGAGGRVRLASVGRPGTFLTLARLGGGGASRLFVHGPPAVASRQWRLGVGAEADAVELELAPSFAEYSTSSFWSLPPAGAAAPTSTQTREPRTGFLFMPLNDLVDEHYTVYTCRYNTTRGLPGYCL